MIRFNCPHCERPYELPDAFAHLPLVCKQCGQRLTPPKPTPDLPPPPPPPRVVPRTEPVVNLPPVPKPAPPKPAAPASPPPGPKAPAAPVAKPAPAPKPPAPAPVAAKPQIDDSLHDDDVLVTRADSTPDIDFNVGGPTAASLSDAARARPAGLSDANRPRPSEYDGATEPDINLDALSPTAPASEGPVDRLQKINLDLLPPAPPARAPRPAPPPEPPAPEAKPEATLLPFIADLAVFVLLVLVGMVLGEQLAGKPTGQVLTESGSAAKFPPIDLLMWGAPPMVFGLIYLLLGSRERSVGGWIRRRQAR